MFFLSFSLPKTGTTYLGNILEAIGPPLSVSKIKEPSFFIDRQIDNKSCLTKILSSGNYHKGFKWYESLYPPQSHSKFDLSTQYWIDPIKSLPNVLQHIDPSELITFSIKRNSVDQLVSYIGQLRRGYLKLDKLSSLLQQDSAFANYILQMYQWSCSDKVPLFASYNVKFKEIDFTDLISDPISSINKLFDLDIDFNKENLPVSSMNQRSKPRLSFINRLLFSSSLKGKLKSYTPNLLYPFLINLRKNIVKVNLQHDNSLNGYYSADKEDLKEFLHCR